MQQHRIHITGASGSGVTTLGASLAQRLGVPQFDVDDYYWMPTDPPFSTKRPVGERLQLLADQLESIEGWIRSGSLVGWGEPLIENATSVIFLHASTPVRLQRLERREAARYGDAILPGGKMYDISRAFFAWAARYDDPEFDGRSLAIHDKWLASLKIPVIRIDGTLPTEKQISLSLAGDIRLTPSAAARPSARNTSISRRSRPA